MIKKVPIIDVNTGKTITNFDKFSKENEIWINKSNWSGEQVKVTINRKKKTALIHQPYMIEIKLQKHKTIEDIYDVYWRYHDSKEWNYLATAYPHENYWDVASEELSRQHENVYAAAAQVVCNVI